MKLDIVLGFFKYCWQSWELWQKLIIFSILCNGMAFLMPRDIGILFNIAGLTCLSVLIFMFWITSMVLPKWAKYKETRNQLFTTIKNSHDEKY